MTITDQIDPVRIGEEFIYKIFHTIFHDDGARNHFAFSQINFFTNPDGLPSWSLWFNQEAGAYQLSLVDAGLLASHHDGSGTVQTDLEFLTTGRFSLRYFPAIDDPLFQDYSFAERTVRDSDAFDHTGTPTIEGRESLGEDDFLVGYLDYRMDSRRGFLELTCLAPDRWREIQVDGLTLESADDGTFYQLAPGSVDRNVPGWSLACHFFNRLVSAGCYSFKTDPYGVVYANKNWSRIEVDKDDDCRLEADPDINLHLIAVGLELGAGNGVFADPDDYLLSTRERLSADGFEYLQEIRRQDDITTFKVPAEWWNAKNRVFEHDHDHAEPHLCCYHDH